MVCRSVSRPASGRFAVNQWTQLTLTRREVVAHLLGHASIATTSDAYSHLKIEDARRALVAAGWLADQDEPR